ncbi:MAG: hypothetical protein R6V07_18945 [Armatimonadota bacterium]
MANDDTGRNSGMSATEEQRPARAAGSRKRGVVGRMTEQARETVQGIRLPRPDWRTFAWGLLVLILIVFIARNWAPLRINVFGFYVDAPRAVVLAIFFGLGMVTTWLIEIRHRRGRDVDAGEEADEPAEQAESAEDVADDELQPAAEDFADDPVFTDEPDTEVQPEPEAFADDDLTATPDEFDEDFDAPVAGEDETAGDPLSDEYHFDQPGASFADDAPSDEELDESDAAQESAGNDTDEASSDEDNSRGRFWRK